MTSISVSTASQNTNCSVNLHTHAGLRQQQIGEVNEHGNAYLTIVFNVFAGKLHTFNKVNCYKYRSGLV